MPALRTLNALQHISENIENLRTRAKLRAEIKNSWRRSAEGEPQRGAAPSNIAPVQRGDGSSSGWQEMERSQISHVSKGKNLFRCFQLPVTGKSCQPDPLLQHKESPESTRPTPWRPRAGIAQRSRRSQGPWSPHPHRQAPTPWGLNRGQVKYLLSSPFICASQ